MLAVLAVATLLAACGDGDGYRPLYWNRVDHGVGWELELQGVRFETEVLGVDGTRVEVDLRIENGSDEPMTLDAAVLAAGGVAYPAENPSGSGSSWPRVDAGDARDLLVAFELASPAADALGPEPTIDLAFRHGEDERRITVIYGRD